MPVSSGILGGALRRIARTRADALGQICDGVARFLLPGGLAKSLRDRARVSMRRLERNAMAELLDANRALKNRHADKRRCFVIGAGPSLRNLDLTKLRGETWIGVNWVHFHEELRGERTNGNYYVVLNPFTYTGEELDARIPILKVADERIPRAEFIFPIEAKAICETHGLFRSQRKHFVMCKDWLAPHDPITDDRLDLTGVIPEPHNTLETAIIVAAYMGFREIYLLGCDVNYFEEPVFKDMHFYSIEEVKNVFDVGNQPNAMGDWGTMRVRLHHAFRVFDSLEMLKEAYLKRGVRIFNASGGGALDVFPCVTFDSLFEAPRDDRGR